MLLYLYENVQICITWFLTNFCKIRITNYTWFIFAYENDKIVFSNYSNCGDSGKLQECFHFPESVGNRKDCSNVVSALDRSFCNPAWQKILRTHIDSILAFSVEFSQSPLLKIHPMNDVYRSNMILSLCTNTSSPTAQGISMDRIKSFNFTCL